ncbi:MAG: diacylglycerol kinase family protein [Pseudonocardiales bacterium]
MPGPLTVVHNPHAGRGRARAAAAPALAGLRSRGLEVDEVCGRDRAEALDLCHAAVAGGTSALVALGGDGTVHLAIQAVAGLRTPLGIIPAGTGNDFAAAAGVPNDLDAAVEMVAAGRTRALDAVRASDDAGHEQWWGCVLGAGFDSAVNERANGMRWPRGRRRYDIAVLAELIRMSPRAFVVEVDGQRQEFLATFVAVGNASAYGGGMRIVPAADLTDGLLDVVVVGPVSRRELIRIKPRVYSGRHIGHRAVRTLRGAVVRLESDGVVAYADGERLAALPVTSRCVPGALNVLAAPNRP